MYKNSEGYPDPTAAAAVSSMMREYKKKQRDEYRRKQTVKNRPKVYIASKYAGDIETNVKAAIEYSRYAIKRDRIPVTVHLLYPQILDDNDPKQRELGMLFGQALLEICDEIWVCGTEHSPGMKQEIVEAKRLGKQIKYFNERMEELHENG